jgi:Flp pilus assembly pilin Flp
MVKLFHRFLKDDSGGSSIQYAFIAVVIPVAFIVSVNCLGPKLNTTVSTLGSATGMLTRLLNE